MTRMSTSQSPLVTIAIPTYNRARTYLRPCLESALQQTCTDIEILVADNGSTDETQALVQSYNDSRIRYYRQAQNITPNDNFNFCLSHARGSYFQLLLDDELIDPDFVQSCLQAAQYRRDFALLRTGLRTIDANGVFLYDQPNLAGGTSLADFFLVWFAGRTSLYLCNTLFNRDMLLEVGGFRSRHNLFQDVIAQARVAACMPRADVTEIKASTRLHRGQFTYGAKVRAWCEDALELLQVICQIAPERRDVLHERGNKFFAMICYSRANAVRSPLDRARAYATVYRLFGRRYMPPMRLALSGTALYRSLRQVKRRVLNRPAWID